jgi:hypothetical protein
MAQWQTPPGDRIQNADRSKGNVLAMRFRARARFCCFSLDELSGVRVALFGFGLVPNHFHAVLELVLAVAADTGVWNSKYVTSTRAPGK